jgi:hypothetical protein
MGVRGTANLRFEGGVRVSRNSPSGTGRFARHVLSAVALLCFISGDLFAEGKPQSAFDWGYRLRLRQEYSANLSDFSNAVADDNNYIRVRSQLWGSWTPGAQWKLYAMLNNEHRHWFKSNKGLERQEFEIHELLVENLYIEGKNLGGTPFGFIAGRQNLSYGEGFICWDGGPLDGSRTGYFNALLFTASFGKRRLDAHLISDPERDRYLTPLNDQKQSVIEWDETGAGLYYTDESFEGHKLEAYYFFKNEKDEDGWFPESDIHTIGARASGKGFGRLTFAVEGAVQAGDRGAQERLAYGGYLHCRSSACRSRWARGASISPETIPGARTHMKDGIRFIPAGRNGATFISILSRRSAARRSGRTSPRCGSVSRSNRSTASRSKSGST